MSPPWYVSGPYCTHVILGGLPFQERSADQKQTPSLAVATARPAAGSRPAPKLVRRRDGSGPGGWALPRYAAFTFEGSWLRQTARGACLFFGLVPLWAFRFTFVVFHWRRLVDGEADDDDDRDDGKAEHQQIHRGAHAHHLGLVRPLQLL